MEVFFGGENHFFLRLILFWNKSVIHRGPYSIVSVKISGSHTLNIFVTSNIFKFDSLTNHDQSLVQISVTTMIKNRIKSAVTGVQPTSYLQEGCCWIDTFEIGSPRFAIFTQALLSKDQWIAFFICAQLEFASTKASWFA